MTDANRAANRVHLIAHAGSPRKDILRLGFRDAREYLAFVRAHLPAPLRLTANKRFFEVVEDEPRGGRDDDQARVRDLQNALNDRAHSPSSPPTAALGFSEMTTLVNLVASYRCGRGLYWLCPNYLAWKIKPLQRARSAFAEFWQTLPALLSRKTPTNTQHLDFSPIRGELVRGKAREGTVRLIGGCISVLAAMLTGPLARRLKPDGRWLIIEDINEAPYRIDRHLAALKLAGWFERLSGVLVGDFHTKQEDQTAVVVEILRYHLPPQRNLPVAVTRSFGHTWPMTPIPLNRPLALTLRARSFTLE
jgi:muramoyltetrapeptide carboxypeptidase LdcA involved in peptidoglycan recycling